MDIEGSEKELFADIEYAKNSCLR
ncbi:hypothetical protein [Paraflavitalea speifideaquila]